MAARELLRDVTQRGLTELAHRLGRQPPLAVGTAVEEPLVHQRPFQFGERTGVHGGVLAELAGQHVEVDVVHRGARVALRQLLCQLLEFGDVGHRLGALTHAHRVVAGEPLRAVPVFAGAGGLQVRVEPVERVHQRR